MGKITIPVPAEMAEYEDDLRYFFETMVRKLFTNRAKGFNKSFDMNALIGGMRGEILEIEKALDEEGQFDVAVEAADAANFAFLIGLASLHMTRGQFEEQRKHLLHRKMEPVNVSS